MLFRSANGGVVEKKSAVAGGDSVEVEYGKGIKGGGGVLYCVREVGMGGERAPVWLDTLLRREELGVGDAATSIKLNIVISSYRQHKSSAWA